MQPTTNQESTASAAAEIPGCISIHNKSLYSDFVSSLPYKHSKHKRHISPSKRLSKSAGGTAGGLKSADKFDHDSSCKSGGRMT